MVSSFNRGNDKIENQPIINPSDQAIIPNNNAPKKSHHSNGHPNHPGHPNQASYFNAQNSLRLDSNSIRTDGSGTPLTMSNSRLNYGNNGYARFSKTNSLLQRGKSYFKNKPLLLQIVIAFMLILVIIVFVRTAVHFNGSTGSGGMDEVEASSSSTISSTEQPLITNKNFQDHSLESIIKSELSKTDAHLTPEQRKTLQGGPELM